MNKIDNGYKTLQVHLPIGLHRQLSEAGFTLNISKSEITRLALESFLKARGFRTEHNNG